MPLYVARINTTWEDIRKAVFENDSKAAMIAIKSCYKDPTQPMSRQVAAHIVGYFLAEIMDGSITDLGRVEATTKTVQMVLKGPPYAFGDDIDRQCFADWMICDVLRYPTLSPLLEIVRAHCNEGREAEARKLLQERMKAAEKADEKLQASNERPDKKMDNAEENTAQHKEKEKEKDT
jgi:hypothetical protein